MRQKSISWMQYSGFRTIGGQQIDISRLLATTVELSMQYTIWSTAIRVRRRTALLSGNTNLNTEGISIGNNEIWNRNSVFLATDNRKSWTDIPAYCWMEGQRNHLFQKGKRWKQGCAVQNSTEGYNLEVVCKSIWWRYDIKKSLGFLFKDVARHGK